MSYFGSLIFMSPASQAFSLGAAYSSYDVGLLVISKWRYIERDEKRRALILFSSLKPK